MMTELDVLGVGTYGSDEARSPYRSRHISGTNARDSMDRYQNWAQTMFLSRPPYTLLTSEVQLSLRNSP